MQSNSSQFSAIVPELLLAGLLCMAIVLDLARHGRDSRLVGWLSLAGSALIGFFLLRQWRELGVGEGTTVLNLVRFDRFAIFFKLFALAAHVATTVLVLCDRRERRDGTGEYHVLLLGATLGLFFLVGTTHFVLAVLAFELLSLASYALAGFHKHDKRSAEAALKYAIFGGLSVGVMVYGISLLYGISGTLDLTALSSSQLFAAQLARDPAPLSLALLLILCGIAFKISAVPFHFWAPDVYEGAPTPVTTFLSTASKAGGFALLLRLIDALVDADQVQGSGDGPRWTAGLGALLAVAAAVTMTLGNFSALRQASLKRLLAFSSIAHAGYMLMGVATLQQAGFEASIYYLLAYYPMNIGAFGFLLLAENITHNSSVASLRGLGPRAALAGVSMVLFLTSLVGLPPTVGFYGKLLLFRVCLDHGLLWLVALAALNTVLSVFYYFRVVKALFLSDTPAASAAAPQPLLTGLLVLLALATLVFGVWIAPLESLAISAASALR